MGIDDHTLQVPTAGASLLKAQTIDRRPREEAKSHRLLQACRTSLP